MSLSKILVEFTQKQLEFMRQYGAEIVAWHQTDEYEIMLFKDKRTEETSDGEVEHQLGFQRKGMDFLDLDQQMDKVSPKDIPLSELREISEVIKEWVDKYGNMAIGSNNMRKQNAYVRIFKRLGFNVEKYRSEEGVHPYITP